MNREERLTIRYDGLPAPKELCTINKNGEVNNCDLCEKICKQLKECDECPIQKCFNRLCELEDKLENGTMIELPCKVGDKIYRITSNSIREETVLRIRVDCIKNKITLIISTEYLAYASEYINEIMFFTKAEAEARLKELQNEF